MLNIKRYSISKRGKNKNDKMRKKKSFEQNNYKILELRGERIKTIK